MTRVRLFEPQSLLKIDKVGHRGCNSASVSLVVVSDLLCEVMKTLLKRQFPSLQTLLDGCCSGPILVLGDDGQFRLDAESVAVVQDLRLLSDILLDWKIWARAEVRSELKVL